MSRVSRRCEPVPLEVRETADLLERRWQLSIIYAALTGALRFSELRAAVGSIGDRMLSVRLRELEARGLVSRHVLPGPPVRVEYALTAAGRGFRPGADAVRGWGAIILEARAPKTAAPAPARAKRA